MLTRGEKDRERSRVEGFVCLGIQEGKGSQYSEVRIWTELRDSLSGPLSPLTRHVLREESKGAIQGFWQIVKHLTLYFILINLHKFFLLGHCFSFWVYLSLCIFWEAYTKSTALLKLCPLTWLRTCVLTNTLILVHLFGDLVHSSSPEGDGSLHPQKLYSVLWTNHGYRHPPWFWTWNSDEGKL